MSGAPPASTWLRNVAFAASLVLAVVACREAAQPSSTDTAAKGRIVTVGGQVTEIAFAIGAGDRVVAVDTSSVYPPEATKLPQVGYQRTLAAEPILALSPAHVVVAAEAGPPVAIEQLRSAGVDVVVAPEGNSIAAAAERIRAVATALGETDKGELLATKLEKDSALVSATAKEMKVHPRVVMIYARGAGAAMVSGRDTAADVMIKLSGGINVVDSYEGFRPLSAEAIVAAAPDAILVPARGLDSLGGIDGLLKLPGMSETPAGKARRVLALDDALLLGFGPRLAEGIRELAALFLPADDGLAPIAAAP